MTRNEAIKKYEEKFGSYPYLKLIGESDDKIVEYIEISLETGKEIETKDYNIENL